MILSCNSCDKKFVVPDSAISASGRMVQCGSCGNKWKQFPLNKSENSPAKPKLQSIKTKAQIPKKIKIVINVLFIVSTTSRPSIENVM